MSNIIRNTTELALYIVKGYMPQDNRGLTIDSESFNVDNRSFSVDNECFTVDNKYFTVIDATCGNGHDTLALANMLWESGETFSSSSPFRLYAFDIQKEAIDSTETTLREGGFSEALNAGNIKLIHDSHENIRMHLPDRGMHCFNIAVFNLGYLPGGNKEITTSATSTLATIKSLLEILSIDGIICITMYSGHINGAKEKAELLQYAEQLDSSIYHVSYVNMLNQHKNPPEILLISRKR